MLIILLLQKRNGPTTNLEFLVNKKNVDCTY